MSSPVQVTRKLEFARKPTDELGRGERAADSPGTPLPAIKLTGVTSGLGTKQALIESDVVKPNDAKPTTLGDVPMIGRLFRSETDPSGGIAPPPAPPSPSTPGLLAEKPVADLDGERGLVREDALRQERSLNRSGAGALTLNGANTFGGGGQAGSSRNYVNDGTIVSAGTLALGEKEGRGSSPADKKDGLDVYDLNIVGYANVQTEPFFSFQPLSFQPAAPARGGQSSPEKAESGKSRVRDCSAAGRD